MISSRTAGLAAGTLAIALLAAPGARGAARPVTVDLRIEGPTRTLFEGRVTTGVRAFRFTGDRVAHECDGTAAANGGVSSVPVPTRGAALAAAAESTPFSIKGTWFDSLGPSFSSIRGQKVSFDPATRRYLVEYLNWRTSALGSCAEQIHSGDQVLFAYGDGSEPLLKLSGPTTVRPGAAIPVKVVDGRRRSAIAGASVGGVLTGADGGALVPPPTRLGLRRLKATKPGTIRSNSLQVCVTDGIHGTCRVAFRDHRAPSVRVAGIRDGESFSRASSPRTLQGSVTRDASGIRAIELRLTRRRGKRCAYYSPARNGFRRAACGRSVPFRAAVAQHWAYALAARLAGGRYLLSATAVDGSGNRSALRAGRNLVGFSVR